MTRRYYRMSPAIPAGNYIPYVRATSRQRVTKRLDPANWVVASIGVVLGIVEYRDTVSKHYGAVVVEAVSATGRYIKVCRLNITSDGVTTWGVAKWAFAAGYYRIADSLNEFALVRRIAELEAGIESAKALARIEGQRDVNTLSQATVTRALVHAADNDYCAETAVALISAGHKMPNVTLEIEVTMRGSITLEGKRNYYPLRRLFGATRGEVQGASGLDLSTLESAIQENVSEFSVDSITHLDTDIEWHAPTIRPPADLEYSENNDVMHGQENTGSSYY